MTCVVRRQTGSTRKEPNVIGRGMIRLLEQVRSRLVLVAFLRLAVAPSVAAASSTAPVPDGSRPRRTSVRVGLFAASAALLLASLPAAAAAAAAPPENDNFADVEQVGWSVNRTTTEATKEIGEPNHAGNPGGHSVWFSVEASFTGRVAFDTCGADTNFDTLLAVYTGLNVGSLTQVAANNDSTECGAGSTRSSVSLNVSSGATYWIAVDGAGGDHGAFRLQVLLNDDFAQAAEIEDDSLFINTLHERWSGSNAGATKEAGEPNHTGNAGGGSVWFSYTPTTSRSVIIDTCDLATFDTLLAVYTGLSLGALTPVASNDDTAGCGDGTGSRVTLAATAGTTYRIALDGHANDRGLTTLTFANQSTNDDFANATDLGSPPSTRVGSTARASKETGEPNHAGNAGGKSVWYRFRPTTSGPVSAEICQLVTFDALLAVYTGSSVDNLTPVASYGTTGCGGGGGSRVPFVATAGTTYWIAVDGTNGDGGQFLLELRPPPSNDDFADARDLGANPSNASANTAAASKEVGEANHAGNAGLKSVWYRFTPSTSGQVMVEICDFFDTLLAVYTGSSLGALTPVASNDDTAGCGDGTGSSVTFAATAGTTYRIALDGKNGGGGFSNLTFTTQLPNDDFANSADVDVGSDPTSESVNTVFATKEAGEPDHAGNAGGKSVWYRFTPATSGPVTVDTCDAALDTLLAVYTGSSVGTLTEVASNDDTAGCGGGTGSRVTFSATAGTTSRLAVDGKNGAGGQVRLEFQMAPDTTPPQTTITDGPAEGATTSDSTPTFEFTSSEQDFTFNCRIDAGASFPCVSAFTTAALADGQHTFSVTATDSAGNLDPTPATRTFTVQTEVTTTPQLPAPTPPAPAPPSPPNPSAPGFALPATIGSGAPATVVVTRTGSVALARPQITCPSSPPACTVTMDARAVLPPTRSRSAATKKSRIGKATVSVAPSATAKVRFKLTKKAMTALKRTRRLTVTIKITARHGTQVTTKTFRVTLKAPKR
jgi:hypothetical protein